MVSVFDEATLKKILDAGPVFEPDIVRGQFVGISIVGSRAPITTACKPLAGDPFTLAKFAEMVERAMELTKDDPVLMEVGTDGPEALGREVMALCERGHRPPPHYALPVRVNRFLEPLAWRCFNREGKVVSEGRFKAASWFARAASKSGEGEEKTNGETDILHP